MLASLNKTLTAIKNTSSNKIIASYDRGIARHIVNGKASSAVFDVLYRYRIMSTFLTGLSSPLSLVTPLQNHLR